MSTPACDRGVRCHGGLVHPERPPPSGALGEPTAEKRAGDAGDTEDGAHDAHVLGAFPDRYDVGDDGLGQDHETAAAESLDGAVSDQPGHVRCEAADDGSEEEDGQRADKDVLATEKVTELAIDRHHHRGGNEVGGSHPQHVVHPIEFPDDRGQCGGEDCLREDNSIATSSPANTAPMRARLTVPSVIAPACVEVEDVIPPGFSQNRGTCVLPVRNLQYRDRGTSFEVLLRLRGAGGEKPALVGEDDQLRAVVGVELRHDAIHVGLGRERRDV